MCGGGGMLSYQSYSNTFLLFYKAYSIDISSTGVLSYNNFQFTKHQLCSCNISESECLNLYQNISNTYSFYKIEGQECECGCSGNRIDYSGMRIGDEGNRISCSGMRIGDEENRISCSGMRIRDEENRIGCSGMRIGYSGNRIDYSAKSINLKFLISDFLISDLKKIFKAINKIYSGLKSPDLSGLNLTPSLRMGIHKAQQLRALAQNNNYK